MAFLCNVTCDGLGGTVKRLAARTSLQRPYSEQIMTPRQLFEWASINIPTITFTYTSLEEYERQQIFLETRFQKARTIPGTHKYHSFVPISKDKVRTRYFSSSKISKEFYVSAQQNELDLDELSGFVTCCYDKQWWVACVLQIDTDGEICTVRVAALHPHGPSSSFKYPTTRHILNLSIPDILTKVDPGTRTGRVYTLTSKESKNASEKLRYYMGTK